MTEPTPVPPEHAPADPWNADAFTERAATDPLLIDLGTPVTAEDEKPRRRRNRYILALSIVLPVVLLAGAGAFAARYWTGAGITEAESAVPANVIGFARIDVNPGLRDRIAVNSLFKKFPNNGTSTTDELTAIETDIAKAAHLDYATDVQPWFGGQAGVALWPAAKDAEPVTLVVLSSTDDAAATAALTKVRTRVGAEFGFVLHNGFAVIAGADKGAQADASLAATDADQHSLADNQTFRDDVSHLDGNNLILGYVDLGGLAKAITSSMSALTGSLSGGFPGSKSGGLPSGLTGDADGLGGLGNLLGSGGGLGMLSGLSAETNALANITGTEVVGVSIADDGVEIRSHSDRAPSADSGTANVRPLVDAQPAGSLLALSTNGLDPNGKQAQQLSGLLSALPSGGSVDLSGLGHIVTTFATAKTISVAMTTKDSITALFVMASAADATSAAGTLTGLAPAGAISATASGTTVKVTIGTATASGTLGSDKLYKEATAGMTTGTTVGYIDVTRVAALFGSHLSAKDKALLAPVKAVAFDADGSDALIRIIIK